VRASSAEKQLEGSKLDEAAIRAAASEAVRDLHPTSDLHGSSEYRVRLLRTMVERALTQAAQRATRKAS
jgi:carbon-monoxide dehydrogenase medium subunit